MERFFRKVRNIIRGWTTLISGRTPEFTKKRLQICRACPHNRYFVCTLCGCPLAAKARAEDEECDIGKWKRAGL